MRFIHELKQMDNLHEQLPILDKVALKSISTLKGLLENVEGML